MNVPIADLWQGQSLQPAWKRYPGQVDLAQNATLDPLDGARMRNPSILLADIPSTTLNPQFNYYIASLRQFRVFIRDGELIVLDEDGTEMTVHDESGGDAYLNGLNRFITDSAVSLDTLIIVNKNKVVLMGATAAYQVLGEVLIYSDLFKSPDEWSTPDPGAADPKAAPVGSHFKVLNDENLDPAGHYVKVSSSLWTRVAAPSDPDGKPNLETWPHRLVYRADTDDFVYDTLPLNDRLSGNSATNPVPHLVGGKIKSAQFLGNRLAFIGQDSLKLTAANDVFTIFADNVNNITDADPIELDINLHNIGTPVRTEVIGDAILVLCENGQFSYGSVSTDPLSPINNPGRIRQITDFKTEDIYPGTDGNRLVFLDQLGQMRAYQWDNQTRTVQYIGSTTEHVVGLFDDYDVEGVWLDGDTTYVCTTSPTVFIHQLYFRNGSLEQSAWSTYVFNERIRYLDTWADQIRLVSMLVTTSHSLLSHQRRKAPNPEDFDFTPRLDRLELLTGNYVASADQTEFVLTGRDATIGGTMLVTTKNFQGETDHQFLRPVSVNGRRFRVKGKWTGYEHYAGFRYTYRLVLSKLYAGLTNARPVFRAHQNVFHHETFSYTVKITREGGRELTVVWPSDTLNAKSLNATQRETGHASILILGDAKGTTIEIVNDTPGPVTISALGLNIELKGRA